MTAALQALLAAALLAAVAYGVYEFQRWRTPAGREAVSPGQRRLRAAGLFFLLLTLGLWLYGTTLRVPHRGQTHYAARYIAYWMGTTLAALPLLPLALLDWRINIRRLLAERDRLRQEMLSAPGSDTDLGPGDLLS